MYDSVILNWNNRGSPDSSLGELFAFAAAFSAPFSAIAFRIWSTTLSMAIMISA